VQVAKKAKLSRARVATCQTRPTALSPVNKDVTILRACHLRIEVKSM